MLRRLQHLISPPTLETFAAIHNSVATQELVGLYTSYPFVHRGHHWTAVSPYFVFETEFLKCLYILFLMCKHVFIIHSLCNSLNNE